MHTQGKVASIQVLVTERGACHLCSNCQGGPMQHGSPAWWPATSPRLQKEAAAMCGAGAFSV